MHRTQLYIDEPLWQALRIAARQQQVSVSELVRRAARERYLDSAASRREAMLGWVGVRRGRQGLPETQAYVRQLRQGRRLQRLAGPAPQAARRDAASALPAVHKARAPRKA